MLFQINNSRAIWVKRSPFSVVPKLRLRRAAHQEDREMSSSLDSHQEQSDQLAEVMQRDFKREEEEAPKGRRGAWKNGILPFNLSDMNRKANMSRKAAQREAKRPSPLSEQEIKFDI